VSGCDVVAVEAAISAARNMEMKRGLNLDLLLQAVERICAADEGVVGVPGDQART
jgi:hypothetical protein